MNETDSTTKKPCLNRADLSVYFAAGISILRDKNIFRDAINDIKRRCQCEGINRVRVNAFYPYGYIDHVPVSRRKRYIIGQAANVFGDMLKKAEATNGGRSLFSDICIDYDADGGGNIVLIGHSGGGVASYKAGLLLEEAGYPIKGIFIIEAPKMPIQKKFQERVYALERCGRLGDLVSRIGFDWFKPPRERVRLPIIAGHPFYFCNQRKDDNNVSNMNKVLDMIWGWIYPPGVN